MAFEIGATPTRPSFYNDSWFEASPLSSSKMVSLQFKHGEPLQVHQDLLFRHLVMLHQPAKDTYELFRQFINRISRSAGHILVQFLYTNRYISLRWKGPTDDNMVKAASLHTATEVYATARLFKLSWLEYLAEEITKLGKDVDLFTIIDIVKETYPDVSGNDTWFPTFIKSTMKAALEKPRVPATAATSLDKMLLWGAMEVFRDKLDALTTITTSAAEQHMSDPTPAPPEEVKDASQESEFPSESLSPQAEPVTCPVEEPLVEKDPSPEPEPEVRVWDLPAKKRGKAKKGTKKGKAAGEAAELISETLTPPADAVAFPEEEPLFKEEPLVEEESLPEPIVEEPAPVVEEPEPVVEDFFGLTKKGKKNKKKKGKKERSAEDETLAPIEEPALSPIAEGWVGAESDS